MTRPWGTPVALVGPSINIYNVSGEPERDREVFAIHLEVLFTGSCALPTHVLHISAKDSLIRGRSIVKDPDASAFVTILLAMLDYPLSR